MNIDSHGVSVHELEVRLDGRSVLEGVELHVEAGSTMAVIGPNGSGKSTLLRAIYRAVRPARGTVFISGKDTWKLSAAEAAKLRSVVTQHQADGVGFTSREVVAMGRYPHSGRWATERVADVAIVADSLRAADALGLADRVFDELSGGERQRVLIARALAQDAPLILLDEPTNHLDAQAQLRVLATVSSLSATTIAAVHDVNHALAYADQICVLSAGRLVAVGTPAEVVTPRMMRDVFGVKATLTVNPYSGAPFAFLGLPDDEAGTGVAS